MYNFMSTFAQAMLSYGSWLLGVGGLRCVEVGVNYRDSHPEPRSPKQYKASQSCNLTDLSGVERFLALHCLIVPSKKLTIFI